MIFLILSFFSMKTSLFRFFVELLNLLKLDDQGRIIFMQGVVMFLKLGDQAANIILGPFHLKIRGVQL